MKAEYSKNKGLNNKYYRDLLLEALKDHKTMNRKDINNLLIEKLPACLSVKQKETKVGNILGSLRKENRIINIGSDHRPIWKLRERNE